MGDIVVGHPLGIGGNVNGAGLLERRAERLLEVGIDRLNAGAGVPGDRDIDVGTEPEARHIVHRTASRTGIDRGSHGRAP